MTEDRVNSDALYDGAIKKEINRIKKSNLPGEVRDAVSEAYWRLGHDLADDRDYKVIMAANSLLGLADSLNAIELKGHIQKFVELYKNEKPLRETRRKMEAEREARKYTPEATFAEDLKKLNPKSEFAGQEVLHFNSLYGKLTIPDACYIFLEGYSDSKKRPYPYLVGEDERSAGEIWESIEPLILDRATEMLDNDVCVMIGMHKWIM